MTLYGLKNCDSCRAARKWLQEVGVDCEFHDIRSDGLPVDRLQRWLDECGIERVINRRGTTWRRLSDEDKAIAEGGDVLQLLADHPTLIKRPVLEHSLGIEIGFSPARYEALLAGAD